ncbi:arginine deiminase family protein [Acidianus sp. HS-5]|uniref:arginine deiminase family protein n=1 Tax=Acidianus sp. HS-5 TaxID=2886040 RepID=UPI001F3E7830|nr:arginine deiminase family protein [Acidianus sp. HS-5]BDC17135.1 arginine deiminase 1 [Acidianus sp. HS-5]
MLRITSEWSKLRTVLVHEPGIEMFYGILDPDAFLYMRRFNIEKAINQHKQMVGKLEKMGIEVLKVKEAITQKAKNDSEFRKLLEKIALNYIKYEGDGKAEENFSKIRKDIEKLDAYTLFDIILLNPTVLSHEALGTNETVTRILNEEPLANLYFTRDQSIITDQGVIIGRMSKRIRRRETEIIKLVFQALSEKPLKEITEPAFLEGGDFMPFKDFAIFGTGDRTSISGIMQAIDFTDFNEIVIAYNPEIEETEDYMLTMHLDMYLNTPKEEVIISNSTILNKTLAHIYERKESGFTLKERTNLLDFFKRKGYKVIEVGLAEQLSYATNFLTIENSRILSPKVDRNMVNIMEYLERKGYTKLLNEVKEEYNKHITDKDFFPNKKAIKDEGIEYEEIDVSELTGGFGGIHCMTMPIKRE